jgi:FHA domain-containing protein
MPPCVICGEALPAGARSCSVCGSSQPDDPSVPVAAVVSAPAPTATALHTGQLPPGSRVCPACARVYGAEFSDAFCECGVELLDAAAIVPEPTAPVPATAQRPPPGTPCLTLFGADKQPVQYFALTKDAVLIGRLDAVAGNFPEIDVMQWLEPAAARKVSRKHALILRSRQTNAFSIRPLAGNTGTQIEADMVPPLADYPLRPGTRLILGGAVRLKFEIT